MSHTNYTTEGKKHKHLTERERYQIEVLKRGKIKPYEIAKRLGRHVRTMREIVRGTVRLLNTDLTHKKIYCADTAQNLYEANARNKGPTLKIGHDHKLAKHIEDKILNDKYSPDAVIGEIKRNDKKFETNICTKTLYNYIDKGVFAKITNKDLPVKKNKKKGTYRRVKIAYNNLKGTSIEERPKSIEKRDEYGHWEMDCVVGKRVDSGSVLLVLSERQTRQELLFKMPNRTQQSVINILDKLRKETW